MQLENQLENVNKAIEENTMVLSYFTTKDCNLCKSLYPKIETLLKDYPEINGLKIETDEDPSFVGTYKVFLVPTIILFINGKETLRESRNVSVFELDGKIKRYYDMLF